MNDDDGEEDEECKGDDIIDVKRLIMNMMTILIELIVNIDIEGRLVWRENQCHVMLNSYRFELND